MPHDHKNQPFDVGTTVRTKDGGLVYTVCGYCVADRPLPRFDAQAIADIADGKHVRYVHYWHEVEVVTDDPAAVKSQYRGTPEAVIPVGDQQILWGD